MTVPPFEAFFQPRVMAEVAREAEAAGWDGFFLWDHVCIWPTPVADAWVSLAAVALATEHIKLGPLVTPMPRRRPVKLARETITLDHLSNGRLILGVGSGLGPWEYEYLGDVADPRTRAAMLDEGLQLLTRLWTGEPQVHHGRFYTFRGDGGPATQKSNQRRSYPGRCSSRAYRSGSLARGPRRRRSEGRRTGTESRRCWPMPTLPSIRGPSTRGRSSTMCVSTARRRPSSRLRSAVIPTPLPMPRCRKPMPRRALPGGSKTSAPGPSAGSGTAPGRRRPCASASGRDHRDRADADLARYDEAARVRNCARAASRVPAPGHPPEDYVTIARTWRAGDHLELELPMVPRLTQANPRLEAARGALDIERGPIVCCLEECDNPDLQDVAIDPHARLASRFEPDLLGGVVTVDAATRVWIPRI